MIDKIRLSSSIVDLHTPKFYFAVFAELMGTFLLVFIGLGSSFVEGEYTTAFGYGLGGCLAIYCIGSISGGHINPAVSFSLLVARQISLIRFIGYFIGQVVGAILATYLAYPIFNAKNETSCKLPSSYKDSWKTIFPCEVMITFVLTFVILRMCVEKSRSVSEKAYAPFLIGIAILVGVLIGAQIESGCMNPAAAIGGYLMRTTACNLDVMMNQSRGYNATKVMNQSRGYNATKVMIQDYDKDKLAIYSTAPYIGGLIAALLQQLVYTSEWSLTHIKDYLIYPIPINNEDENNQNIEMK